MSASRTSGSSLLDEAPCSEVSQTWPSSGRHILASFDEDTIVVYQAFNDEIADYAIENQLFGGPAYSTSRMTWIKTNFLWMMYRSAWGTKDANQKRTLAVYMDRTTFESILEQSWPSSYSESEERRFGSQEAWQAAKAKSEAVLQWDPDHDYHGFRQERRAIQIGIRAALIESLFNTPACIRRIQDISTFVAEQHARIQQGDEPLVMKERVYKVASEELSQSLGLEH